MALLEPAEVDVVGRRPIQRITHAAFAALPGQHGEPSLSQVAPVAAVAAQREVELFVGFGLLQAGEMHEQIGGGGF